MSADESFGIYKKVTKVDLTNYPEPGHRNLTYVDDIVIHAGKDEDNSTLTHRNKNYNDSVLPPHGEEITGEVSTMKGFNTNESKEPEDKTNYKCYIHSFMFMLKLFGLYYENDPPEVEAIKQQSFLEKYGKRCYPYMITFLVCVNFGRTLTEFNPNTKLDSHFLRKVVYIIWVFLIAAKVLILVRASEHRLPVFFRDWTSLHKKLSKQSQKDFQKWKNRSRTLVILSFIFIALNTTFAGYAIFTSTMYDNGLAPLFWDDLPIFPLNTTQRNIAAIVYLVIHFFLSAYSVLPVALYHLLCYILTVEFRAFNKDFKARLEKNKGVLDFGNEIEVGRLTHRKLASLTKHADKFLKQHFFFMFICSVAIITMVLYNQIYHPAIHKNIILAVLHAVWLVILIMYLMVELLSACEVNKYGKKCNDAVTKLDTSGTPLSARFSANVSLFLYKCSNSPPGLTPCGLFIIDRRWILTVVSLLVTYFLFLSKYTHVTNKIVQHTQGVITHISNTMGHNTTDVALLQQALQNCTQQLHNTG